MKERNIVNYLSGNVFATLYQRIRKSKQCNTISNVQSTSILLAGKCGGEDNNSLPDDNLLVVVKNRGGLLISEIRSFRVTFPISI